MLFLQANIGNIFILILSVVIVIFFPQVESIPLIFILLLIYLDITLHSIAFEYQRISLTLARIAKFDSPGFASLSIPEIQLLISSTPLSTFFFYSSFITGFIIAYLYLNSFIWLGGYFIVKYLLADFIPTYKPYKLLFSYMDKEFKSIDLGDPINLMNKVMLQRYYDEMPHSGKYEDWAFNKYGADLLKVK